MAVKSVCARVGRNAGLIGVTLSVLLPLTYPPHSRRISSPFMNHSMEVLLLEDIAGIGKKNDLLVVGDGFALNNLLPRRAALVATPLVRKRYADLIRRRAEERETERAAQAGSAKALSGKSISFTKKVTKAGKLYAAINQKAIVEAIKEQLTMDLTEDAIMMDEPIKSTGTHSVRIKMNDQMIPLSVVVDAEKEAK